ncbi:MAG: toll/interleukin-1 receptor domain-containing protein [Planctomycetes bacterium]|nr:toll/interleukin-1 receptor domain-containing protein [Planctomycetota bacterium]
MAKRASQPRVFLHYVPKWWAFARKLGTAMESEGFEVLDPFLETLPGANPGKVLAKLLEDCDSMVVVLTPEAEKSRHFKDVLSYAAGQPRFMGRFVAVIKGRVLAKAPIFSAGSVIDHKADVGRTAAAIARALEARKPRQTRSLSA